MKYTNSIQIRIRSVVDDAVLKSCLQKKIKEQFFFCAMSFVISNYGRRRNTNLKLKFDGFESI